MLFKKYHLGIYDEDVIPFDRCGYEYLTIFLGWGFVALAKDHPSKISWMKWLQ